MDSTISLMKYFHQVKWIEYIKRIYILAKNCLAYCSERLLEITGISLPVIPLQTQFQIRFDSTGTLENLPHKASCGLWPFSWGISCEVTLQQISFWTSGSLLCQEFWLIYIWRIGISKIIPILSIIMMVLGYFNSHLLPVAKRQLQEFKSANMLHCLCHTL